MYRSGLAGWRGTVLRVCHHLFKLKEVYDMITLDLTKKSEMKLDLTKAAPALKNLSALMKWDMHPKHGASLTSGFDPDLFAFLLNDQGKVSFPEDAVFFNNMKSANGAVKLENDNRSGGDEPEVLTFDLANIPADKHSVAIYITIFEYEKRKQHFGMMANAKLTLLNKDNNEAIAQYNLVEDFGGKTALHVGNLNRLKTGGFEFEPIGIGAVAGPNEIINSYV